MNQQETFLNRIEELNRLNFYNEKAGLIVMFGRRRIGKSSLLKEWIKKSGGHYSQAIESSISVQIEQLCLDFQDALDLTIKPKNWIEFFELLSKTRKKTTLCIDEFPYLSDSDPSLPSIIQRFIDHKNKNILLVLSGSSKKMMAEIFQNHSAALFNRAKEIIHLKPMDYKYFCKYLHKDFCAEDSFELFSMVGGIPKYWEYCLEVKDSVMAAEKLYFRDGALMEFEPKRLMFDEQITGKIAWSILESIGRGAEKATEIASRLGLPLTQINKVFSGLIEGGFIKRFTPFGSIPDKSKQSFYRIIDPSLLFWFRVYSPHRGRWYHYDEKTKKFLIHQHASQVFEEFMRNKRMGTLYWESSLEFDSVFEKNKKLYIDEIKFKKVKKQEMDQLIFDLQKKFNFSKLSKKYQSAEFNIISLDALKKSF